MPGGRNALNPAACARERGTSTRARVSNAYGPNSVLSTPSIDSAPARSDWMLGRGLRSHAVNGTAPLLLTTVYGPATNVKYDGFVWLNRKLPRACSSAVFIDRAPVTTRHPVGTCTVRSPTPSPSRSNRGYHESPQPLANATSGPM